MPADRGISDGAIRVRHAKPADAAGMAQVHVAAWRTAYVDLLAAEVLDGLDVSRSRERWATILFAPPEGSRRLVAVTEDDTVCGMSALGAPRSSEPEGTGELWMLNVSPDWWGQGVGAALLRAAERELTTLGYWRAVLWVLTGNTRARRFYQREGWTDSGARRQDPGLAGTPDEVQYARELG
ncbi:GNAT superfamily N-acetyltransferase [Crossiella equi]|uniref:GNAT superfamily N-acetyltransferase n=1 Tax=Crossiella equi TaxID=130796 RepID=A0ABS5A444_9PSEU|nr:GNAT family N-acetyltransferase [Crossiella equi]MBP2471344.1 GNAT superfamily N-acetyltransferase [Crossiella equi]